MKGNGLPLFAILVLPLAITHDELLDGSYFFLEHIYIKGASVGLGGGFGHLALDTVFYMCHLYVCLNKLETEISM